MAFKKAPPPTDVPASPDKLFLALPRRKIPDVLPHQREVLRRYSSDAIGLADVALQLPTGSGKTLVGLLIAEWRRRKNSERIVYLCPTRQLVNQVVEQASEKYGLTVLGFSGRIRDYECEDFGLLAYLRGQLRLPREVLNPEGLHTVIVAFQKIIRCARDGTILHRVIVVKCDGTSVLIQMRLVRQKQGFDDIVLSDFQPLLACRLNQVSNRRNNLIRFRAQRRDGRLFLGGGHNYTNLIWARPCEDFRNSDLEEGCRRRKLRAQS